MGIFHIEIVQIPRKIRHQTCKATKTEKHQQKTPLHQRKEVRSLKYTDTKTRLPSPSLNFCHLVFSHIFDHFRVFLVNLKSCKAANAESKIQRLAAPQCFKRNYRQAPTYTITWGCWKADLPWSKQWPQEERPSEWPGQSPLPRCCCSGHTLTGSLSTRQKKSNQIELRVLVKHFWLWTSL